MAFAHSHSPPPHHFPALRNSRHERLRVHPSDMREAGLIAGQIVVLKRHFPEFDKQGAVLRVIWPDPTAKRGSAGQFSPATEYSSPKCKASDINAAHMTVEMCSGARARTNVDPLTDRARLSQSKAELSSSMIHLNVLSALYGSSVVEGMCFHFPVSGSAVAMSLTVDSHTAAATRSTESALEDTSADLCCINSSTSISVIHPRQQHNMAAACVPTTKYHLARPPGKSYADTLSQKNAQVGLGSLLVGRMDHTKWVLRRIFDENSRTREKLGINTLRTPGLNTIGGDRSLLSTSTSSILQTDEEDVERTAFNEGPLTRCCWVDWGHLTMLANIDPVTVSDILYHLSDHMKRSGAELLVLTNSVDKNTPAASYKYQMHPAQCPQLKQLEASQLPIVGHCTTCSSDVLEIMANLGIVRRISVQALGRSAKLNNVLHTVRRFCPRMPELRAPEWTSLLTGSTLVDFQLGLRTNLLALLEKEIVRFSAQGSKSPPLPMFAHNRLSIDRTESQSGASLSGQRTIGFHEVLGSADVKSALAEMVLRGGQNCIYSQLGLHATGGVLLFGPPGCSKTLLARSIAQESNRHFAAIQGPQLMSKWLGESERAIRAVFARSRANAPSLVFIDEIDSIAYARSDSSSQTSARETSATNRILTQLLVELDGVTSSENVVVIAATNRPDLLDRALLRPGRLDRLIYCPPPDAACIEKLLRQSLAFHSTFASQSMDLSNIAKLASSLHFSAAEVIGMMRASFMRAIECDSPNVLLEHFHHTLRNMKPVCTQQLLDFYSSWSNVAQNRHRTKASGENAMGS